MKREGIRAFAQRDWAAVEDLKRDYWAQRARESDGLAGLRAGQMLYQHARAVRPDLPSNDDRADDLAHHVELKRLLDQASRALAERASAEAHPQGSNASRSSSPASSPRNRS